MDKLCVSELCGDKLCVSKLCVSKLCGDKVVWNVEVAGGQRDEEAGGGGGSAQPKARTLHKDVGNNIYKHIYLLLLFNIALKTAHL